jgi:glycogen debranching enzyme
MVPNLLDSGRRPRFNCRDAQWWFLQAVKEFCEEVNGGEEILKAVVKRRFPINEQGIQEYCLEDDTRAYSWESKMEDIIQEILQAHASGISFREWNAGPNLDSVMRHDGFQIDVRVDWTTGFVFGGNEWNCGTWMDKMGEVERLGTRGVPATSRNGAAVEIVGLSKSVISWLQTLNERGIFPYSSVNVANGKYVVSWCMVLIRVDR